MISFSKRIIKKAFNQIGFDIVRISKSPKQSLLGLRNLPIKTIIDVGANTGQFAKYISTLFPEAHVYCFEPLPDPYKELSKWVEKQNGRVRAFNIALSDSESDKRFFAHIDHSPSSSFLKTTDICENYYHFTKNQEAISVKITTLDKWLKTISISPEPEILIKIDVQGYENRVIMGGAKTFKMAKACVLEVGIDILYERQASFRDITTLLHELGFRYAGNLNQTYSDDGHVMYIDAVFVKSKGKLL